MQHRNCNAQSLDAVLPLTLRDYPRFKILLSSMNRFFNDLGICWVVAPDSDLTELKSAIKDDKFRVISETSLVPELKLYRKVSGWYKQQMVKLAIAEKIETDFYLTLDADVICVKPTSFSDLVKDHRAYCYKHSLDKSPDKFQKWYRNAERVLKISRAQYHHDVTPAILSKAGMLELHKYLSRISNSLSFSCIKRYLLFLIAKIASGFFNGKELALWRLYLLDSLPWTEYSIYYTFLEAFSIFEKFHYVANTRLSGNSVWYMDDYSTWKPEDSFEGIRNFHFSVIQSNTGIDPNEVWGKVKRFLLVS